MTFRRISGNRTAEDIVREYYERVKSEIESPQEPVPSVTITIVTEVNLNQIDFLHIPADAFSRELIDHYAQPTLSLDLQNGLFVAKKKLQKTPEIIEIGRRLGIDLQNKSESNGFLGGINWYQAKQLVEDGLQARMITPALYFPILKWAESNDEEFANDLKSNAEWLDAVTKEGKKCTKARYLVHTDKDLNGGQDYGNIVEPHDKSFEYTDIETFTGLPTTFRDSGKFFHYYPEKSPTAAVRGWDSILGLYLSRVPSFESVRFGVRVAKNLP